MDPEIIDLRESDEDDLLAGPDVELRDSDIEELLGSGSSCEENESNHVNSSRNNDQNDPDGDDDTLELFISREEEKFDSDSEKECESRFTLDLRGDLRNLITFKANEKSRGFDQNEETQMSLASPPKESTLKLTAGKKDTELDEREKASAAEADIDLRDKLNGRRKSNRHVERGCKKRPKLNAIKLTSLPNYSLFEISPWVSKVQT